MPRTGQSSADSLQAGAHCPSVLHSPPKHPKSEHPQSSHSGRHTEPRSVTLHVLPLSHMLPVRHAPHPCPGCGIVAHASSSVAGGSHASPVVAALSVVLDSSPASDDSTTIVVLMHSSARMENTSPLVIGRQGSPQAEMVRIVRKDRILVASMPPNIAGRPSASISKRAVRGVLPARNRVLHHSGPSAMRSAHAANITQCIATTSLVVTTGGFPRAV